MEKTKLYREPGKIYINIYKSHLVKQYPEKYELVSLEEYKKFNRNKRIQNKK